MNINHEIKKKSITWIWQVIKRSSGQGRKKKESDYYHNKKEIRKEIMNWNQPECPLSTCFVVIPVTGGWGC